MNIRLKTLTAYSYGIKVDAIKNKLKSYNDEDFLTNLFTHFQSIREPKVGVVSNFPWCCFLAMKWKFVEKSKNPTQRMNYDEFIKIINRIYDLQSEASSFGFGDRLILSIRRMMINQLLYQQSDKFNYSSLARQFLWYCEGDDFYEKLFYESTGLHLNNYYQMASYLTIIGSINEKIESEVIPLKLFILHLVPKFGAEQVKQFLSLVSLRPEELRGYFLKYKREKNVTVEYYEDTPIVSKPLILTQEGVTINCKRLMKAGLVSLVPDLLKAQNSKYKIKFGRTLEDFVSGVLNHYSYDFLRESDIKKEYRRHKLDGMSIDFLVSEPDGKVFIDCKAIEPGAYIKTSNDPNKLQERLESSFIKGIVQGEECASLINSISSFPHELKLSIIIVVHRDHFISTGVEVENMIQPGLFERIRLDNGGVLVDPKRIYYITIDEFEHLLGICREKSISINHFIDHCVNNDSSPSTRKASISMHMSEIQPEGVKDLDSIRQAADKMTDDVFEVIKDSSSIWSGRVEEYMAIKDYILS